MRTPFRYGNRLFTLAGQLLIFPALKDFIADVFGYGRDRNRAIDTLGTQNNACEWAASGVPNVIHRRIITKWIGKKR